MKFNVEQRLMQANIIIKDSFDKLGYKDSKMKSP